MRIQLRRVKRSLPEYEKVRNLYNTAFPDDERAPFYILMMKTGRQSTDFWSVYMDEKWVGMAYIISEGKVSYLFYLAVDERLRGKGYGSRILKVLKRMYEGQKLFLALEKLDEKADNYAERISRRNFYLKNGLSPMNCSLREGPVVYDVMGIGEDVTPEEYRMMMDRYIGRFMRRLVKMEVYPNE